MSIDYTEYVEAPEGLNNLQFPDEKQQATFELGVSMVIHSWDDLKTAVDNQWGGPNSDEKRDWITSIVVELFTKERIVDVSLIEETLLYVMVDEFEVEIDDDSALIIGKRVMDVYKDCKEGKFDGIKEMYAKWQVKQQQNNVVINRVVVQEDPENPDLSDDEKVDEEIPALVHPNNEDLEMIDVDEETHQPIVDDDGFELVQKKGKSNRRR